MTDRKLKRKYRFFVVLTVMVFLLLFTRLAMLQLVEGSVYSTKAKQNQFRFLPIQAPRGDIVDRKGKPLAQNKIVNTISIMKQSSNQNLDSTINNLAAMMHNTYPEVDAAYIKKLLNDHNGLPYEPVVIKRDVSMDVITQLEEHRREIPGVLINKGVVRYYPNNGLAAHVLGYVSEISREELNQKTAQNYKPGDLVGRYGIEAQYEKYLRGQDGFQQVEVDVSGRPVPHENLITVAPKQGDKVTLTIDSDLQKALETSIDNNIAKLRSSGLAAQAGAGVVINVKTGAVLAMASRPGFDPNKLVPPVSEQTVKDYLNPPAGVEPPMINRTISSLYPPGSTFKPITGMAALESGKIDTNTTVTCHGAFVEGSLRIACDAAHGTSNLIRAMAVSCNVFFITVGKMTGIDMIDKIGHEFGLDTKTGIDLPGEISGLLPGPAWKKALNGPLIDKKYQNMRQQLDKKYQDLLAKTSDPNERKKIEASQKKEIALLESSYRNEYSWQTSWHPYDTYNMSFGQGDDTFTPIELADYVAAIANGGNRMRPYLVQKIEDSNGHIVYQAKPSVVHKVAVSQKTIETIKEAMMQVTSPGGTGAGLFDGLPVKVAAKTGTAEVAVQGRYNGLFIAFAPADNPEIAFAGVMEAGHFGASSAGPVAADVFRQYFMPNSQQQPAQSTAPVPVVTKPQQPVQNTAPVQSVPKQQPVQNTSPTPAAPAQDGKTPSNTTDNNGSNNNNGGGNSNPPATNTQSPPTPGKSPSNPTGQ